TNPDRIFEWHRDQYLLGADREAVWLFYRIQAHHSAAARDLRKAFPNTHSDPDCRSGKHGNVVWIGAGLPAPAIRADDTDRCRCRDGTLYVRPTRNCHPRAGPSRFAAASVAEISRRRYSSLASQRGGVSSGSVFKWYVNGTQFCRERWLRDRRRPRVCGIW